MTKISKIKALIKSILTSKTTKQQLARWKELYGEFDQADYKEFQLNNLPSESKYYHGELVKWASDTSPKTILFVGENLKTAAILKKKNESGRSLHNRSVCNRLQVEFRGRRPEIYQ